MSGLTCVACSMSKDESVGMNAGVVIAACRARQWW